MGRVETAKSLDLERSMNMQIRILTIEEHLKHMDMIDGLDDKRRIEAHGAMIWHNSMQRSFFKRAREVIDRINEPISKDIFALVKDLISTIEKWETFHRDFQNKVNKIQEQEILYENHDDQTRKFLISYSNQCKERLCSENRGIEKKLILENFLKSITKK